MTDSTLAPLDPPKPDTVTDLAQRLGVNRRRIAKWRKDDHGPATLDLADWSAWLKSTGRTAILARLDPASATLAGPARETAAAAPGIPAAAPADDDLPALQKLPDNASSADVDRYWKSFRNREQTLVARNTRRAQDRDLVAADEVVALLVSMATAQLEAVGDGPWLAIRPMLDGVPESLRKGLRAALGQWGIDLRARLSVLVKDHMHRVAHPTAT